jgi:DNA replication protein DnaC
MESLNDILNRTDPSLHRQQEHRSTQQGTGSQGQRPRHPLVRRPPLPEQTTRSRQEDSPVSPTLPPSRKHPQQTVRGEIAKQGQRHQVPKFPPQRTNDQMLHRSQIDRRSSYPHHEQPLQEPGLPASRSELRSPNASSNAQYQREAAKVSGDFYEAYPAMHPADVQEEWDEGETSMRFGDWEVEVSSSPQHYPQTDPGTPYAAQQDSNAPGGRGLPQHQAGSSYMTRNTSVPPAREQEARSPLTRNLREERYVPAQPPVPQAPAQEAQHYQRTTQPLNPRAIAGMSRQPSREVEVYERVQQVLPASSVFAVVSTPPQIQVGSKSVCAKCKGAGYLRADVPFGHPNFGKPIACECKEAEKREKRRQQLLELSDLGAFHHQNFRNFIVHSSKIHPTVQEAFHEAQRFAQNPNGWLVLIGPNGCGKTHLAAAIANQNLRDGAVVLFTVVPDLLAHLRATFAPTSTEAYDQRFAKMRESELLVLDDLGSHQSSPWANEKLFQLLNYRYNSGYPTVITANKQGLMGLDERILSRLTDNALVTTVRLNGAIDFRPQNPRREPPR